MTAGLRRNARTLLAVGGAVILATAPAVVDRYRLFVLATFLHYVLLAGSWNLLAGYAGLLSLGNYAFLGVGAYGVTLLLLHTGLPLVTALLGGALAATMFGVATYLPLFRLRGGYFAISTLLLGLVVQAIAVNSDALGASAGLSIPPALVPDLVAQFRLALAGVVIFFITQWWLLRSRTGLFMQAIRDDETGAEASGVHPLPTKAVVVAVSAFFTGLAGGLVAVQLVSIEPMSAFGLGWMLDIVVIGTIGGLGTRFGPVLGAAVIIAIQQLLQDYEVVFVVLEAALLIVVVQVAPNGLMGVPTTLARVLTRRREVSSNNVPAPRSA